MNDCFVFWWGFCREAELSCTEGGYHLSSDSCELSSHQLLHLVLLSFAYNKAGCPVAEVPVVLSVDLFMFLYDK